MGANNKNYQDHQRTFINTSPSNKKQHSTGSQRPSPSKSINIRTPNKNGYARNNNSNYYNNNNNSGRLSLSGSPTNSFFANSKCFESPPAESLPQPPKNWMTTTVINNSTSTISSTNKPQFNRVRKALILPMENNDKKSMNKNSCAMEYATAFSTHDTTINDHFTQSLKLLLNVNA
ncbi:hypothetical protein PVAND_003852 [Polypedilum vanderplanki]|uniref:Uncharacterized protein n=1 Tax=Polypedilum vanderplanki TaxID=319348 RepID=A0A9J6BVV3_POLVA|nr:hypothetical protein PVAND_003852 [Polypedilum vanderplanki]